MNVENEAGYHTAFKDQQSPWPLVLTLLGRGLMERTTSQGTLSTLRILKRAVARCPTRTLVKINLFSSVMNTPLSCTVWRIWQRLMLLQIRCSSKMDSMSSTTNAASRPEGGLRMEKPSCRIYLDPVGLSEGLISPSCPGHCKTQPWVGELAVRMELSHPQS